MIKTMFAAAALLLAASSLGQASVSALDETGAGTTLSQRVLQNTLNPSVFAENENDGNEGKEGNDDNGGADDDDNTGCTAAKAHDKYTICHG
jgi:hypothetical protein